MRINQKRFILVDYFNLCVKHLKMMIKEKRDEVLTEQDQDIKDIVRQKVIVEYLKDFDTKIE